MSTAVAEVEAGDGLAVMTPGEELAASIVQTVNADLVLAVRQNTLHTTQIRLRKVTAELAKMIEDLNANWTAADEKLVRFHVDGQRDALLQCFLAVQPRLGATAAGRQTIAETVDGVLAGLLAQIKTPEPGAEPPARPTKGRSGSKSS